MTGQKNKFSTTEKLWNLDDKQLKTPKHDAMVLWLMEEENLDSLIKPIIRRIHKDVRSPTDKEIRCQKESINYNIESEVPLKSSPTFIAGYADLITKGTYENFIKEYPCPIEEKWLPILAKINYFDECQELLCDFFDNPDLKMDLNDDRCNHIYWDINKKEEAKIGFYDSIKSDNYWNKRTLKRYQYEQLSDDEKKDIIERYKYKSQNHVLLDFVGHIVRNLDVENEIPVSISDIINWIEGYHFYKYVYGNFKCLIEVKPYIDSFGAVLRQIKSYKQFWLNDYYNAFICLFTLDTRFDKQFESQGIFVLHPPEDFDIDEIIEYYGL